MPNGRPTRLVPDPNAASPGGDLVASRVISTKPEKLLGVMVYNSKSSQQFIQVFEESSLPANGTVPTLPAIPIAATSVLLFQFGDVGVDLDKITICNSSTAPTKTIGSADCQIVALLAA